MGTYSFRGSESGGLKYPWLYCQSRGATTRILVSVGDGDSIWKKIGNSDMGALLEVSFPPRMDEKAALAFDTGFANTSVSVYLTRSRERIGETGKHVDRKNRDENS